MTNNELLHASLLDILFDGRNKSYGAYVLRRDYNRRLLLALGLGLSVIVIFILLKVFITSDESGPPRLPEERKIITIIELPPDPEPQPERNEPKPAKPEPPKEEIATIKNSTIKIMDDNLVPRTEVPDVSLFADNISDIADKAGMINNRIVQTPSPPVSGTGNATPVIASEVSKPSSPPEFPGGFEALRKFLYRHLATPDQLGMNAGEKITVKVRFVVGEDGAVSIIEIRESGGNIFDREVIRVCKKMPKWKPAIQRGEPVSANYVLPVTFIGEEQ